MELPNGSNCLVLSENEEANKPVPPKSSGAAKHKKGKYLEDHPS